MVRSPLSDVEIPLVPVHLVALQRMAAFSDRIGLVDGITEREYTYKEIISIIRRVASGLKKLGLQQRDIVAFLSPNCPEYIFMFFATLCCGATVSTINPVYTAYEVGKHLEDSKPKFIFVGPDSVATVKAAGKQIGLSPTYIVVGQSTGCVPFEQLVRDDCSAYPHNVTIDPKEDVAVIPYSSGTTGFPKGVMITHYNIVSLISQLSHPAVRPLSSKDEDPDAQAVAIAVLPYFHAAGLMGHVVINVLMGSKQITMPRFDPNRYLQLVEKYKVTVLLLVPPMVVFLAKSPIVNKYDMSSVKSASCGAAPLSKETEIEFSKRFNVPTFRQGYGMSESTLILTIVPADRPLRPGSCGIPVPNVEMQVVDPDTKEILGPNKRGEIWARGPNIMKGYLNRPDATRDTLDDQGWLHTGDVGYYDDESYFFIVDRIKELIKYKGFQVAPAELEALLLNHPDISDVAVIGVPDKEAGELPRAYIVRKPNRRTSAYDVSKYVADHMSSFKHLRGGVEFVETIPKTQSGKILRRELRDRIMKSKV